MHRVGEAFNFSKVLGFRLPDLFDRHLRIVEKRVVTDRFQIPLSQFGFFVIHWALHKSSLTVIWGPHIARQWGPHNYFARAAA